MLANGGAGAKKVKRTPRDIYRPAEMTPLLPPRRASTDEAPPPFPAIPILDDDDGADGARIVKVAIYANFAANLVLLVGKAIVVGTVPSVSVLASFVDAVLDFLSTAIVWTTTHLISRRDHHRYPVGRRR